MPIKDATKDDILAMKQRLKNSQADLQINSTIKMVNHHRNNRRGSNVDAHDYKKSYRPTR